jgi:hypothetical protein
MIPRATIRPIGPVPALLLLLGAAACAPGVENPFAPNEPVYRSDGYVPGASAIVCYRTLAEPDCYARPQPGPPNRVIAAYDELYPPAPIEVVPAGQAPGAQSPADEKTDVETPGQPRVILQP